MAQWIEHQTSNLGVAGSSPAEGTPFLFCSAIITAKQKKGANIVPSKEGSRPAEEGDKKREEKNDASGDP